MGRIRGGRILPILPELRVGELAGGWLGQYGWEVIAQPPLVIGPTEIAAFLLANAIIAFFCAPRLMVDFRRWIS
ncbi:MAG: hypothetical protein EXR69_10350 [Myxococcales bacterium]|nr:hypothetical protein [Myxococcales bacterium]